MEENKEYKVLGVYRNQSLIPALIMFVIHAFTTANSIASKVTFEEYSKLNGEQISDLQEWYFFYPTLFLAFFFLGRYSDYLFKNKNNNRIFGFLFSLILGWFVLMFFRILFLVLFYWQQM